MPEFLRSLVGLSRRAGSDEAFIWALKDVSFDIREGERIGIIGRNGAGKSTLLKILSRVAYPTAGEARIRGRITALLEVGTGFNEDLTGRDNIYLNASLHGLSRWEIDQRLEDIIEFSEVRRFIDTPVKHYSSGMRMRLAFSVAAHLDPDILMLDEVLAVGDLSFQRKCLERMEGLTAEGRTLLFVSHSMDAVTRFCDRCIWIKDGQIESDGPVQEVISQYLEAVRGITPAVEFTAEAADRNGSCSDESSVEPKEAPCPPPAGTAIANVPSPGPVNTDLEQQTVRTKLIAARIINARHETAYTIPINEPIGIEVVYDIYIGGKVIEPGLHFRTEQQVVAFVAAYIDESRPNSNTKPGRYTTTAWVPPNLMNSGIYYVTIVMTTPDPMERHESHENVLSFHVHEPDDPHGTARGRYGRQFPGPVRPLLTWHTSFANVRNESTTQGEADRKSLVDIG